MNTQHETLVEIAKEFKEVTLRQGKSTFSFLVANPSAKKTAILLHGLTGNKLDMVVIGRAYVQRGYAVYAPDLPAHGSTPSIQVNTFHDLGTWLRDCVAATGRTPDILLGDSFAAAICYDFAQQGYMAPTTHLILACPTPVIAWSSRALRTASHLLPIRLTDRAYNSRLGINLRVRYLFQGTNPSAYWWLIESEHHKKAFIDIRASNILSMLLETHNPYAGIRLPRALQERVTVIVGEKDNVVTRESLPVLKRILPYARMLLVPHAGHILHFEAHEDIGNIDI
jgi:pimeloyl-ACP methyl ester carboxylesterase